MGLYTELSQNQASFQNYLAFQRYSSEFCSPTSRNTVENAEFELCWITKPMLTIFSTILSYWLICFYREQARWQSFNENSKNNVQYYERTPALSHSLKCQQKAIWKDKLWSKGRTQYDTVWYTSKTTSYGMIAHQHSNERSEFFNKDFL